MRLRLFVYGSLKQGEFNWHILRDGVVSSSPARARGELFLRPDGYPSLKLAEEPLAWGSDNFAGDLSLSPDCCPSERGDLIEGELLILEPGVFWLERLDRFEGFFPNSTSEYLRALVALEGGDCAWTYVAVEASEHWRRIASWKSHFIDDLRPFSHEHGASGLQ